MYPFGESATIRYIALLQIDLFPLKEYSSPFSGCSVAW